MKQSRIYANVWSIAVEFIQTSDQFLYSDASIMMSV